MTQRIDIELLGRIVRYEASTGHLYWLKRPASMFQSIGECNRWNTRYAGQRAFRINADGYISGMIFRKMYRGHILAWALARGEWPAGHVDHINGNRADNRLENLRVVSVSQNARNTKRRSTNTSGRVGVCASGNGWRAYIREGGKNIHLGCFLSLDLAAEARQRAEAAYGYHPNHGRTV